MEQSELRGMAADATLEPEAEERAERSAQASGLLKKPEALSPDKHGRLRVDRSAAAFRFARSAHLAPLTIEEFAAAAAHFPIVFIGENMSPCAVMGVERGENLFVDEKGAFPSGTYVPAYFRQHPFLLARDSNTERNVLLLDAASESLSETAGEALFEAGKPSSYLTSVYAFLTQVQEDWKRTRTMMVQLRELGLVEKRSVTVRRGGAAEPQTPPFRFFSIAAEKVDNLDAAALKALAQPGHLKAIYAQQVSLHAWARLEMRARPRN